MKKILSLILIFCSINISTLAIDFDSSIDENIRNKFNVEENNLPALPSFTPTEMPEVHTSKETVKYNPTGKIYKLKSGTKINLYSKSNITDNASVGSKVTFAAAQGFVADDGTIIPAGTIFKGTITDAHRPQISANGGLIELKIDEIYYNGIMSKIETKLCKANYKKVFFSDIKGKHSYWKNTFKAMNPGRKAFKATHKCASELGNIRIINLLSPVVWLSGALVYVVNTATAPVIAIFTKGGSLSLPAGTYFQIKLINDTEIRG